jgi:hypothetical protein
MVRLEGHVRGVNPLAGVEQVDWAAIPSGYGDGAGVHRFLHDVVELPPGPDRDEAFDDLWQGLVHQGTVSPATAHALPFVVGIAEAADHPMRVDLLAIVACCAHPRSRFDGDSLVPVGRDDPARVAVRALLSRLAALGDSDQLTRVWVAASLGQFPESAHHHGARLGRWLDEAAAPGDAALHALALLCLGERTPDVVRFVEQQRADWGEDVDQDVLTELLAGRSDPDRDFADLGQLLEDAAILQS